MHRFAPKYDEEDTITVPADTVLLSIGQSIEWGSLLEGSKVKLGRGNTAQADSLTYQTGEKDVFVGGDCCTGPKLLFTPSQPARKEQFPSTDMCSRDRL